MVTKQCVPCGTAEQMITPVLATIVVILGLIAACVFSERINRRKPNAVEAEGEENGDAQEASLAASSAVSPPTGQEMWHPPPQASSVGVPTSNVDGRAEAQDQVPPHFAPPDPLGPPQSVQSAPDSAGEPSALATVSTSGSMSIGTSGAIKKITRHVSLFGLASGARERYNTHRDYIDRMRDQATMLVVTFQIIVGLRGVHSFRGGSDYPSPFDRLVGALEMLTLDLFQIFHVECFRRGDYWDNVYAATLAPLCMLASSFAVQGLRQFLGYTKKFWKVCGIRTQANLTHPGHLTLHTSLRARR